MNDLLFHLVRVSNPTGGGVEPFAAGAGDNDYYGCPRLRQAAIPAITAYNPTAGSITWFPSVVIGGARYQTAAARVVAPGANDNIGLSTPVLSSGQGASVHSSAGGLIVTPCISEFDRHRFIRAALLAGFAAGDNILYAPSRSACLVTAGDPLTGGILGYFNGTAGARTIQPKLNGAPVGAVLTIAPGAQAEVLVPACLNRGDVLAVSSDSALPGQVGFLTAIEA